MKDIKNLTKQDQIRNCLLALSLWAEVNPRKVELDIWRCGTQSCFGGHLATWPEFQQAFGIQPDSYDGRPLCVRGGGVQATAWTIARLLFGNSALFDTRNSWDGDEAWELVVRGGKEHYKISDHQLIVRRLERQIEVLSS